MRSTTAPAWRPRLRSLPPTHVPSVLLTSRLCSTLSTFLASHRAATPTPRPASCTGGASYRLAITVPSGPSQRSNVGSNFPLVPPLLPATRHPLADQMKDLVLPTGTIPLLEHLTETPTAVDLTGRGGTGGLTTHHGIGIPHTVVTGTAVPPIMAVTVPGPPDLIAGQVPHGQHPDLGLLDQTFTRQSLTTETSRPLHLRS